MGHRFTDADRAKSAETRRRNAAKNRQEREYLDDLSRRAKRVKPEHMRGLLAKMATEGDTTEIRVRAAQAFLRESRDLGEEHEIEPLYVADAPPGVLEELDAQLALPLPDQENGQLADSKAESDGLN